MLLSIHNLILDKYLITVINVFSSRLRESDQQYLSEDPNGHSPNLHKEGERIKICGRQEGGEHTLSHRVTKLIVGDKRGGSTPSVTESQSSLWETRGEGAHHQTQSHKALCGRHEGREYTIRHRVTKLIVGDKMGGSTPGSTKLIPYRSQCHDISQNMID